MFYDRAKIEVRAGRGGNGCVSFRREKFVPKGGPDGGDGGRGGDVVFVASGRLRDLTFFQRQRHFRGGNGKPGQGSKKNGKNGDDVEVEVPRGTRILDEDGNLLADLVAGGQRFIAAHGGEGGRGNTRFVSPTRRAPRFAELGLAGREMTLRLELKLLADAGLLGFPNAGKSSLLSRISHARPKVADYPFTTTAPMLGTIEDPQSGQQFTVADIPGLLEGASEGVGLGDSFLAHLERTSLLIHLVDAGGYYGREPLDNFRTINRELRQYSPGLAARTQLIAINKTDLVSEADAKALAALLAEEAARRCREGDAAFAWLLALADGDEEEVSGAEAVYPISAATGKGITPLMQAVFAQLKTAEVQEAPAAADEGRVTWRPGLDRHWEVVAVEGGFQVRGAQAERLVAKTDFENDEAVAWLQERLEKLGVSEVLRQAGAQSGDDVVIAGMTFEFW